LDGGRPASPPSWRAHFGFGPMSLTPVRAELKCTLHSVEKKL